MERTAYRKWIVRPYTRGTNGCTFVAVRGWLGPLLSSRRGKEPGRGNLIHRSGCKQGGAVRRGARRSAVLEGSRARRLGTRNARRSWKGSVRTWNATPVGCIRGR